MTPFVVDANAINIFQKERISDQKGEAHQAIDAIYKNNCIAIDQEKLCLQEWIDCAGGAFPFALMDWVTDEIVAGRIRLFNLADNTCRKHLLTLGLPAADHKWVRLAVGCEGRKLVTGDIDFFDPAMKRASSQAKAALKDSQKGPCAKALRKVYDVTVMCLDRVPQAADELLAA